MLRWKFTRSVSSVRGRQSERGPLRRSEFDKCSRFVPVLCFGFEWYDVQGVPEETDTRSLGETSER